MSFIEDNDQTQARRQHLEALQNITATNAYPNRFRRSSSIAPPQPDTISRVVDTFAPMARVTDMTPDGKPTPEEKARVNQQLNHIKLAVAGRIAVPPRVMGKAAFAPLSDGVRQLQIYVRKGEAGFAVDEKVLEVEAWEVFKKIDAGDFIGVRGFLFITNTGELTLHVEHFEFLAKALQPMPDKRHGLEDAELRQRRRYLDLIAGALRVELKDKHEPKQDEAPVADVKTHHTTDDLTPRQVFERRARLITAMRRWLDEQGYVEVETPMLAPVASGAAARPFVTHHNALDIDLYARIAPELYLKRLLVGGFERVYELNRNFRNEGLSIRHNPEFTMLEFYAAYMDADEMMTTCERILRDSIRQALQLNGRESLINEPSSVTNHATESSLTLEWNNHHIDFGQTFARLTMKQAIVRLMPDELKQVLGATFDEAFLDDRRNVRRLAAFINAYETQTAVPLASDDGEPNGTSRDADQHAARLTILREMWDGYLQDAVDIENASDENPDDDKVDLTSDEAAQTALHIQNLFETLCEDALIQPTFITDFPKAVSPLAKANPTDASLAERFELYIGGMEVANGFSELNDPDEQHQRFLEQQQAREQGDDEAMQLDEDYLRALSYGMPPAAGLGIGIDRLAMLITNRRSIRDVILFPHLRPEKTITEQS